MARPDQRFVSRKKPVRQSNLPGPGGPPIWSPPQTCAKESNGALGSSQTTSTKVALANQGSPRKLEPFAVSEHVEGLAEPFTFCHEIVRGGGVKLKQIEMTGDGQPSAYRLGQPGG